MVDVDKFDADDWNGIELCLRRGPGFIPNCGHSNMLTITTINYYI